jgi:hypothetical protein
MMEHIPGGGNVLVQYQPIGPNGRPSVRITLELGDRIEMWLTLTEAETFGEALIEAVRLAEGVR